MAWIQDLPKSKQFLLKSEVDHNFGSGQIGKSRSLLDYEKLFMNQALFEKLESEQYRKDKPEFAVGDTVRVHVRVREGDKERIQVFTGTVIGRRGRGLNETFTVRRISYGEGVERVFPLHSPLIVKIEVERRGSVRRAKLTYLRKRVGKSALAVKGKAGAEQA